MHYFQVILSIGALILVHEFGHFLAGRWAKIPIAVFSIGFGPKLLAWKPGATEFRLSWIPLGGYVLADLESEKEYFAIAAPRRMLFALGGPLANILASVLGFAVLNTWQHGLSTYGFLLAPWLQTSQQLVQMLGLLPRLFSHPAQLTGVVGMVSLGAACLATGAVKAMLFMVAISLNLAVINLLPIPGLDGGKILLALLEKIHPRLLQWQVPMTMTGMALLLGLMLYTTAKDIYQLFI